MIAENEAVLANQKTERIVVFKQLIRELLPEANILSRFSQRVAYATDASFYHLVPELVLLIDDLTQVTGVIKVAAKSNVGITFRAAGTSLSGQAVTDSVLLVITQKWSGLEVQDGGNLIKVEPSIIGTRVNQALAPYHRKIGPDPASIDSCKIGGIAANNSSGMCCGVANNSYHTLQEMSIVFADGCHLDTGDPKSVESFLCSKQDLVTKITNLAERVKANAELSEKIRHKYRLKNTTGYGINALLDFSDPIEIIKHLMIGSEGTLGFMSNITFRTLPLNNHSMASFIVFSNPEDACDAIDTLSYLNISAIELLDYRSIICVEGEEVLSNIINTLSNDSIGLLVEIQAQSDIELEQLFLMVNDQLKKFSEKIIARIPFTSDSKKIADLWRIRKGIFPTVGARRPKATTVIIEDIAVPMNHLSETIRNLQYLFKKFEYADAVIFGHAKDGNLHFVFSQSFDSPEETERYQLFMNHVTSLVAEDMKGSLKAEHGTGRNMAPFVEKEWGKEGYLVMKSIKTIFDPLGVLNPGVVINSDPSIHLKSLKSMPAVDEVVDQCIECGFCESVCPSNELTFSPRQRISVARKISELRGRVHLVSPMISPLERQQAKSNLENLENLENLRQLEQDYQYSGVDTCAATGMCQTRCPVGINTGEYIKELRYCNLSESPIRSFWSRFSSKYYAFYRRPIKLSLNLSRYFSTLLGNQRFKSLSRLANRLLSKRIPIYFEALPRAEPAHNSTEYNRKAKNSLESVNEYDGKKVVYFPACSGRLFAADPKAKDKRSIFQATKSVLTKAGYEIIAPQNIEALCCGLPWDSQGNRAQAEFKNEQLKSELERLTNDGMLPVITDASPCSLFNNQQINHIQVYESIDFIAQFCIDKMDIQRSDESIVLHVTCSSQRAGISERVIQVAELCTSKLVLPNGISCCGFAGEKGLIYPEVNQHALQTLSSQIPDDCHIGVSNSRTCELGLSRNTGIPFQSLIYLLDGASQPKT